MEVGGEIFVPKIPSMKVVDLAEAVAPGCEINHVGIRPGEKLHEILVSQSESRNVLEHDDMFTIQPSYAPWYSSNPTDDMQPSDSFEYASDTNDRWLTVPELRKLLEDTL